MGTLAGIQVVHAMHALIEGDMHLAHQVVEQDSAVDQLEVLIDERILLLVAKRQPAARDLRYVMEGPRQVSQVINLMWILRALERIGDHARNIAELVIQISSGTDVRHSDFETVQQAIDASKVG